MRSDEQDQHKYTPTVLCNLGILRNLIGPLSRNIPHYPPPSNSSELVNEKREARVSNQVEKMAVITFYFNNIFAVKLVKCLEHTSRKQEKLILRAGNEHGTSGFQARRPNHLTFRPHYL